MHTVREICATCSGDGKTVCPRCGGSGRELIMSTVAACSQCGGSGTVACATCGGNGFTTRIQSDPQAGTGA